LVLPISQSRIIDGSYNGEMASQHQTDSLTEELICPVCLDLFTDPVILDCSHSFCRSCITRCWEKPGPSSCPVCQETFLERNLRVSRALGNLSEKARELKLTPNVTGIKRRCEKHQKQLRLFCETDKKLICSICRDAQEHRDHSFLPIDEAAEIYKDKVNSSLKQADNLQNHITAQFAKMHQSLTDREQRVIRELRQREEEILHRMEKNLREIQDKLASVQQKISDEALTLSLSEGDLPVGMFEWLIQYTVWRDTRHSISPGTCLPFSD
uniref:RING-type E3 ubiquitin transferase n=1 Tax=Callorhinchus milii TaxID=7868 RepID=A0A4W3GZA9_CALMI